MHKKPTKPVYLPAHFMLPVYTKAVQQVEETLELTILLLEDLNKLKEPLEFFYYYTRALDITMMVAINNPAAA